MKHGDKLLSIPLYDPPTHMYSRSTNNYDSMSRADIEVIVESSFWLGSP